MQLKGYGALKWLSRQSWCNGREIAWLQGQMASGAELEIETLDFPGGMPEPWDCHQQQQTSGSITNNEK